MFGFLLLNISFGECITNKVVDKIYFTRFPFPLSKSLLFNVKKKYISGLLHKEMECNFC